MIRVVDISFDFSTISSKLARYPLVFVGSKTSRFNIWWAHNYLNGLISNDLGHDCKGIMVSLVLLNNELSRTITLAPRKLSSTLIVLDLSHNYLIWGILPRFTKCILFKFWASVSMSCQNLYLAHGVTHKFRCLASQIQFECKNFLQSLSLLQGFHYSSTQSSSNPNWISYDDNVTIEGKGHKVHFVYLLIITSVFGSSKEYA